MTEENIRHEIREFMCCYGPESLRDHMICLNDAGSAVNDPIEIDKCQESLLIMIKDCNYIIGLLESLKKNDKS